MDPSTKVVALGRGAHDDGDPLNVPVVFTSTYRAGGSLVYGRDGNATWEAFEEVVGALEGGEAVVFPSGMAAIRALYELVDNGGTVIVPSTSYSGTRRLAKDLERRGRLSCAQVDVTDVAAVRGAAANASLLFIESPTNPMMEVVDLGALAGSGAAMYAVDNTFATPLVQQPLVTSGADVVVHSATKLLSGHSDVNLGVLVARDSSVAEQLRYVRNHHGAIPGPMEVFLALRGVRTLAVRVERASATAGVLATRLAECGAVERVLYPGFGTVVSFVVDGGALVADRVCGALRLLVPATSLGGVETTIERRQKYWWDDAAGVPPGLLRMSVGLESVDDLWEDLRGALDDAAG